MNKELYNLTYPQKSIWLTEQFYSNTNIANVSGTLTIHEKVNFNILEKALNMFVKYNDSMRIKLTLVENTPKQYIEEYNWFNINIQNIENKDLLTELETNLVNKSFQLLESNLFNFVIFRFPDKTGGFIATLHHLISDAWTMKLLIDTVMEYYNNLLLNNEINVKNVFTYKNYIKSENDYINSSKFQKDKEYWEKLYVNPPEISSVKPLNGLSNNSINAKRCTYLLDKDISNSIKDFCKNYKISPFTLFLGIFAIYLSRTSGLDEIIVGTPILNRSSFNEKNTTGMFISNVPFKILVDQSLKIDEFLKNISLEQLSLFRHQKYPYDLLLNYIREKFDNKQNLYTTIVSYQNARISDDNKNTNYSTKWHFNEKISEPLDFHIYDMDNTGELSLFYDYQTKFFKENEINEIHNRLMHILNTIIKSPSILLKDIDIVTEKEKQKLLYEFNNTKKDYGKDKTIIDLFKEQVKKNPNDVALVFEDNTLTYKELDEKSDMLANYLISRNIKKGTSIAILLNRSLEIIISMLGILKCGCYYLPLDPEYPKKRIEYILDDSETSILLTNHSTNFDTSIQKIFVELSNFEIYNENFNMIPNVEISSKDLAYVIYTSGSSGTPKGVLLSHQNVNNFITGITDKILFTKNKSIVSITTICFDIFVLESLLPLLKGIKIVLANENEQNIAYLLNKLCQKNYVKMIQTTPSRMSALLNDYDNLDYLKNMTDIMIGGEPCTKSLIQNLKAISKCNIYNMYGPTETTVWSTLKDLTISDEITIGKPICNTQIYVLDKNTKLLPVNIPGEIYIGGDGLSKGYLNRNILTKEKFIYNPYNKKEKIYNTGDIGNWLPNGELTILGRKDFQVKINGHRIELQEIENIILKFPNIKEIIVISKDNQSLLAYFSATQKIDIKKLRNFIKEKLPFYMVPKYFMQLDSLPKTSNNKIDRISLPEINISENKIYKQPYTHTQKILTDIIKKELKIEKISIDDDFFEIGGDSLSAINCVTSIHNLLRINITVKDIFAYPVIENLSNYIDIISKKEKNNSIQNIQTTIYNSDYPISSAQKRIYLSSSLDANSLIYNIPLAILFDGIIDIERLKNALKVIIKNQESLRTSFYISNNNIVQTINNIENIEIEKFQGYNLDNINLLYDKFVRPFDLSKAPLFRVGLCNISNNQTILLFDIHHIISDGTSLSILLKELSDSYDNKKIEPLEIQYKDYAYWEKNKLESNDFLSQKEFFKSKLKDNLPILNLPLDFPRREVKSLKGNTISTTIKKNTYKEILSFCNKLQITPYMFFLSSYFILLHKYSRQEDIIVGCPFANRNLPELKNIIGMFVNNIVIRCDISPNSSYLEFLNKLKSICLNIFENSDYPFDELVKDLEYKPAINRNPIFDTMFIYQNEYNTKINLGKLNGKYLKYNSNTSKFDLSLEIIPGESTYTINFEYCTDLFKEETIKLLQDNFVNIVNEIIHDDSSFIGKINSISANEENKILNVFNKNNIISYIKDKNITKIFEKQVERNPLNEAIIFNDNSITYDELNKKANSLANYLLGFNIEKNEIIGICMSKSSELIIGILAILKTGCAFLPIDPDLPKDRIEYMLSNTKSKLLLTTENLKINSDITQINVNINNSIFNYYSNSNLPIVPSMEDRFVAIYTSGSTGLPKCTILKNLGLNNLIYGLDKELNYSMCKRFLSISSISFDMFLVETLIPLSLGKTIVLANYEEMRIPLLLGSLIQKYNTDFLVTTPSKIQLLIDYSPDCLKNFKKILVGGEVFTPNLYLSLSKLTNADIFNGYGPSETTACSSVKKVTSPNAITIGHPIPNTNIYILDNSNNLCPINAIGELCISGDGVGLRIS